VEGPVARKQEARSVVTIHARIRGCQVYFLGVDFGSQQDHTALALVKRIDVIRAEQNAAGIISEENIRSEYNLIYLERMQLGTPYMQIVDHIKKITLDGELAGDITVIPDVAGVGLPIVQMMRQKRIAPLIPIGIHGGNSINDKNQGYSVPKRDLITALLTVIQSRRLKVAADINHRQALIHEMQSFKMKQSKGGADTYEALMEKDHDDLVLALSYAIWYPERSLGSGASSLRSERRESRDLLKR